MASVCSECCRRLCYRFSERNLETKTPTLDQERILDAAIAKCVPVGKPTDLVALVRRSSSDGLRAILEIDESYELGEDEVTSKLFRFEFPMRPDGTVDAAKLTLKATGAKLTYKRTLPIAQSKLACGLIE